MTSRRQIQVGYYVQMKSVHYNDNIWFGYIFYIDTDTDIISVFNDKEPSRRLKLVLKNDEWVDPSGDNLVEKFISSEEHDDKNKYMYVLNVVDIDPSAEVDAIIWIKTDSSRAFETIEAAISYNSSSIAGRNATCNFHLDVTWNTANDGFNRIGSTKKFEDYIPEIEADLRKELRFDIPDDWRHEGVQGGKVSIVIDVIIIPEVARTKSSCKQ